MSFWIEVEMAHDVAAQRCSSGLEKAISMKTSKLSALVYKH